MPAPDGGVGAPAEVPELPSLTPTQALEPVDLVAADERLHPRRSRAERQKRLGVFGMLAIGWLGMIVLLGVLAPVLPLDDPTENFSTIVSEPPGTDGHILGGDGSGRDILSRMIWGARTTLVIAVASILIGLIVGGLLGLAAGYFRGRTDSVLSAGFDVLLSFPQIILALSLVTVFATTDEQGNAVSATRRTVVIIFALGVVSIPVLARITRANTLAWAQREYVTAARAMGATNSRIMFREILPNVLPAMFSIALLGVAVVIVAEGGLSVLGFGVQLPTPSWGNVLAEGRSELRDAPHIVLIPTIAIFLTVLSLNYLGDVVRARFDVRESAL